jgi:hypothetical protein
MASHKIDSIPEGTGGDPVCSILPEIVEQETVVPSDGIMLIQAETGIGKELVARTIHNLDMRFEHNFVRANCAPILPVCSRVGNSKPTSKPRSCRTLTDRTTHCCVLSFPCSSQAISGGSDRRLHENQSAVCIDLDGAGILMERAVARVAVDE